MRSTISKIIRQSVSNALVGLFLLSPLSWAASPADVRVLVDVSGSMKTADPNAVRGPATALLATLLPQNSRGGIWLFGSDVRPLVPHGPVDARWSALGEPITASIGATDRFTHIESAIRSGLEPSVEPGNACHVILITDGIVDVRGGPEASAASRDRLIKAQIPEAQNKGCRLHTIALSEQADLPLLTQMALQTGGLFTVLNEPGDLIPVMLDALELALQSQQLPVIENTIRVDSDISQLRVIRLTNEHPLQLTRDGMTIDADQTSVRQAWYSGDGYQAMIWTQPTPGTYGLMHQGPSDRILIDTTVNLTITEAPPTIAANQTLGISALVQGPNGSLDDPNRTYLWSFGQTADTEQRQGNQLQTQIDSPTPGRAILTLQSIDATHTRQIQRAFQVLEAMPELDLGNNTTQAITAVAPPQVTPNAPTPSNQPANSLLPPELTTRPAWQLGLVILIGLAVLALAIGALQRPSKHK